MVVTETTIQQQANALVVAHRPYVLQQSLCRSLLLVWVGLGGKFRTWCGADVGCNSHPGSEDLKSALTPNRFALCLKLTRAEPGEAGYGVRL